MSLWTAQDAVAATGGRAQGDWSVDGVSIDTRTLQPGDLFVALKAARDGHDFVAQALAGGAGAALVSRVPDGVDSDAPLLIVDDVLEGLEALGRAARARCDARVVAVTGSVGKTSTKEMLRTVLSSQGQTHAAVASYNNHWGVPLTLARMPADSEFAVIEIGMNHPGEIAPLAILARPHVALITNVAAVHIEAFESLDGIAREKASIFRGVELGGVAISNGDLETAPIVSSAAAELVAQLISFGEGAENDCRLLDVSLQDKQTIGTARIGLQQLSFTINAPGRHFAQNAVAVLAVVQALGLNLTQAAGDLAQWTPPAGRGMREIIRIDPQNDDQTLELIDDAFNASPTSMEASLEVLAAAKPKDGLGGGSTGRRVAVLGDMLELGKAENTLHAGLADLPFLSAIDIIHCVGPRMQNLWQRLPVGQRGRCVDSADALLDEMPQLIDAGDVVLIKGSKGIKVSKIVDGIRKLGHGGATQS